MVSIFCLFSVLWKPVFRSHPRSRHAYLDTSVVTVNLSCEADGFPHPVIDWLDNNSSVRNGIVAHNGSVSTLLLVFTKEPEQLQKYRCVASNSIGSTLSKEATVTIAKRVPKSPGKKLHERLPSRRLPLQSLFATHVSFDVPKMLLSRKLRSMQEKNVFALWACIARSKSYPVQSKLS